MTDFGSSTAVGPADPTRWMRTQFGVTLRTVSSPVGLDIDDLVGVAARRNPRRAHLLVSTVLGKHIPVDPRLVIASGRLLGELVAQTLGIAQPADWSDVAATAVRSGDGSPLLAPLDAMRAGRAVTAVEVLGFAETATGLGHLVADQLRAACYLHSTRRAVPGVPVAGTFEEGHSHATSHLLLPVPDDLLDTDGTLVLVDDELSTGKTAMGTIEAMHRRRPRARYVLASLIDLRTTHDEGEMALLAERLGCRIDVVSLARGRVDLPDGLTSAVADRLAGLASIDPGTPLPVPSAVLDVIDIAWPATIPDGGRHGFLTRDREPFDRAVDAASVRLSAAVRSRVPSGGRVVVIGSEELMYLPLRLATELTSEFDVGFQSTTRSPVLAVDDPGYPVRRHVRFADAEGDVDAPRFVYNVADPHTGARPDLVVLVADADSAVLRGPAGAAAALAAAGFPVLLAVLDPVDPTLLQQIRRTSVLPPPLTGPTFGSYAAGEVQWLLTDLSGVDLEGDVAHREAAIQAGTAHYAESLPIEFQPDAAYQELFSTVLSESAERLALAVGRVTELVLAERGHDVVLASLARAGTPIGVLMRRWAAFRHGLELPHYALSIVRGRGIDRVALQYLARHHDPASVVFVDGWTGKGAIAKELTAALLEIREEFGPHFNDELAVLADPGHCVRTFGTRDDFLIASACLNSTVSGLVSRTVLNDAYIGPGQFHGAKFYAELAGGDVSNVLLDTVSAAFPAVVDEVLSGLDDLAASDREPTFAGWQAIERIREEYGIESVNFVKPGVGETTRVLLRRVPWRILVREADHPDHAHLRLLARQRDVPVEVRPELPYSCVGLIRRVSATEPGEG
ncbi:TRSP domain C terminus to PRTase_2 [Nakamurella panacisegetis]|uniref:TRSP domain C terminus to PRTase_2 n=2 Tax=Nakamurella panacisegetis TaxID=1090615 RepID=A0A1H0L6I0_9ACTN|nr:TRSP domain C terminus to PRTase_2 [Nakamurella panacisegetis]